MQSTRERRVRQLASPQRGTGSPLPLARTQLKSRNPLPPSTAGCVRCAMAMDAYTYSPLVHGLDQPSPADIAESVHDVGAQRSAAAPVRLPPVRELVWVPHDWIRCVGSIVRGASGGCVGMRPTATHCPTRSTCPSWAAGHTARTTCAAAACGGMGVQHTVRPVATQAPCSHHHHGFEGVRTGTWWPPSTPRGLAAPCAIGAARGCTLPPPPAPS